MSKGKLEKFAEIGEFKNVIEVPNSYEIAGFELKGKWCRDFYGNDNPLVLELACGKGEYTVGLGRHFPDKNFLGLDIKGNRIWKGAKTALKESLTNVGFLRTHIDHIEKFFEAGEVSEIWITFPDPQPQKNRMRKRLTHPMFLDRYKKILKKDSVIHLKTDNFPLYEYTLEVLEERGHRLITATDDLYKSIEAGDEEFINKRAEMLQIKTYYERLFLEEGKKICYLSFCL